MSARFWNAGIGIVAVAALAIAALAWRSVQTLNSATPDTLDAIVVLLAERERNVEALRAPPFVESGRSILDSYLVRLRRDGAPASADMRLRIDALADNTTALLTLLELCAPHARTEAFRSQEKQFRIHAIAWRDRWHSTTELFMTGGSFPTAEVPYPAGLADAVRQELRATR